MLAYGRKIKDEELAQEAAEAAKKAAEAAEEQAKAAAAEAPKVKKIYIERSSPSKAPYYGMNTYERPQICGSEPYEDAVAELEEAITNSEEAYRRERAAAEKVLARGRAARLAGRDCCRAKIDVAKGAADIK